MIGFGNFFRREYEIASMPGAEFALLDLITLEISGKIIDFSRKWDSSPR